MEGPYVYKKKTLNHKKPKKKNQKKIVYRKNRLQEKIPKKNFVYIILFCSFDFMPDI